MILAITGYIIGIVLLYCAWIIHCHRSLPPSQTEINLMRAEAAKASGFDRELKWMLVTSAEVELGDSQQPNWTGWTVTIIGIMLIALSTWHFF
jgi:hypothetical protein